MLQHFADLKFNIKTFSLDKLDKFKPNKSDMVYIIPFCANPTGKTITRKQLDDFIDIVIVHIIWCVELNVTYSNPNTLLTSSTFSPCNCSICLVNYF